MKKILKVLALYWYDLWRYLRHSGSMHQTEREQVLAHLVHGYHRIEKGLTMPNFKAGFGKSAVTTLMKWISVFESRYGTDEPQLHHAVGVLKEYVRVNSELGTTGLNPVREFCEARPYAAKVEEIEMSADDFFRETEAPFPRFAMSRHSLRHYAGEVAEATIRDAVELAKCAPSACNRQPVRVYCVASRDKINGMMELQGGNRGFGRDCDKLLVVTGDLHDGNWINERNSIYFDAGLFTMNLCYALHYGKVAHCILNWSTDVATDRKARSLLGIPENEVITILVACGRPAERFRLPCSPRKAIESLLFFR